jgi:hypothetical protein
MFLLNPVLGSWAIGPYLLVRFDLGTSAEPPPLWVFRDGIFCGVWR